MNRSGNAPNGNCHLAIKILTGGNRGNREYLVILRFLLFNFFSNQPDLFVGIVRNYAQSKAEADISPP